VTEQLTRLSACISSIVGKHRAFFGALLFAGFLRCWQLWPGFLRLRALDLRGLPLSGDPPVRADCLERVLDILRGEFRAFGFFRF
jgi:hypothetical protein